MSEEVTTFESAAMGDMLSYATLDQTVKQLTQQRDEIKASLLESMSDYGIKSIDNDVVKITRVEPSQSTSVDLKKFEEKEPVEYAQLLEDYTKVTVRKGSIRITVKKEK